MHFRPGCTPLPSRGCNGLRLPLKHAACMATDRAQCDIVSMLKVNGVVHILGAMPARPPHSECLDVHLCQTGLGVHPCLAGVGAYSSKCMNGSVLDAVALGAHLHKAGEVSPPNRDS
jgi:hypothetical protein